MTIIETILKTYAAEVKAKFDLPIKFNHEDQLKNPITTLFKSTGTALNLKVEALQEREVSPCLRIHLSLLTYLDKPQVLL